MASASSCIVIHSMTCLFLYRTYLHCVIQTDAQTRPTTIRHQHLTLAHSCLVLTILTRSRPSPWLAGPAAPLALTASIQTMQPLLPRLQRHSPRVSAVCAACKHAPLERPHKSWKRLSQHASRSITISPLQFPAHSSVPSMLAMTRSSTGVH